MKKRGRPFAAGDRCSADDVRQAMAEVDLERRSREHARPGALKAFVADESKRTGMGRTKIYQIIKRVTLQRATGTARIDMRPPGKRNT